MTSFRYVGGELELFAAARRWKAYWRRALAPWIRGDVLEVGAGDGNNTESLAALTSGRWVALEPDARLVERAKVRSEAMPSTAGGAVPVEHVCGTLATWNDAATFDTLLYIDVLEHIEDDRGELALAARRLRPGGALVVLAPAHARLFTEFDRAIGHFRRYDACSLAALDPAPLQLETTFYLDSVGLLASLANRLLLHQADPTPAQIATWDRLMVPLSRLLDPLLLRRVGKTVVAVWKRTQRSG